MINEFGETINNNELKEIVIRVRKLSQKQIDILWFSCGWIDSEKEHKNKALPQKKIEVIKKQGTIAIKYLENLLSETPKKEFLNNLFEIEKS